MLRHCLPLAACCLLPSVSAGQWLDVSPSPDRVLWLRASTGIEHGFSGLTGRWEDPGLLDVTQDYGSWMPRWQRHGVHGRPSLHFDGDDWLRRPDGMPTGSYTKAVVVTLDDYQSHNNVLSGDAEHALFFGFSDRAMLFHSGTFVTSSVPTPLGEPTVLIGTYDSTTGEGNLYQNGQWVGNGFAAPHNDPTLQIGAFAYTANFHGSIAELMLYDRVLSPVQRLQLERRLDLKYRSGPSPGLALSDWPRDGSVIARDATDRADLDVAGTVDALGYPQIELRLSRDGVLVETQTQDLANPDAPTPFAFVTTLDAGLHEYDLALWLRDGPAQLSIREARSVVCGDLLLVNGQSNAVASDYHGEGLGNQSQSPWIRSFGTATLGSDVLLDHHWDLAEGLSQNAHGSVGAWALRAAGLLLEEHKIPIGILNGAVGGTAVASHQRNDADPTDLSTIYGRLLHRNLAAGIAQQYRAVLWHQGESDGENAVGWAAGFAALRQDWAEDYPGLERIFLFQVRKGCGVQFAGVREAQRELADDPLVSVMSTTAVPTHDGCHYHHSGYKVMGDRLSRQISRDLYGSRDVQNIDPPNIDHAEWTGADRTAIRMTFRDPDDTLHWEDGAQTSFLLSDGMAVVSGSVSGNTITLQLAGSSTATTLTYDGHAFDGAWIRNDRSVGMLTFFDLPIQ